MADELNDKDTVSLTTKFGALSLGGKNALEIFLFIAVLALAGFDIWSNAQQSHEHDGIVCMLKLNLYMQQVPPGTQIDWRRMPLDLYTCIPPFLYKPSER